jgi:hypothetical protein
MRSGIAALTLFIVSGCMASGCSNAGKSEKAADERPQSVGSEDAGGDYAGHEVGVATAEASLAAHEDSEEATPTAH